MFEFFSSAMRIYNAIEKNEQLAICQPFVMCSVIRDSNPVRAHPLFTVLIESTEGMINATLQPDAVPMRMPQPGPITPRLIRLRDAPFYLGMDRSRFNTEVRPSLVEIRIGRQGVAFDRLDLDAWVDQYKSRSGRTGRLRGDLTWDAKQQRGSGNARASG